MIVEYDFTNMTEKDIFEMKLKDVIPDFGYITCKKRFPFIKFLVDNKFVDRVTEIQNGKRYFGRFMPQMDFRFSRLFDYSPKPVIAIRDCMLYTDSGLRLGNWQIRKK